MRSGKILRQTEVENLDDTLRRDLDVRGFQIAVNDTLRVCRRECGCNLACNLQRFGDRDRSRLQLLCECGSLDKFHDEVSGNLRSGTDVVERADIGMIQRGYHSSFAMEAVGELGQA